MVGVNGQLWIYDTMQMATDKDITNLIQEYL